MASAQEIQRSIDAYTAGFHGAAVVVGVIENGTSRTYESGDLGSGHAPLDDDTLFQIGSVTKTFTATLFAQMILRGDVRPHDPIQEYLPTGVRAPTFEGQPITLLSLAQQNSGLPRLPTNIVATNPNDPYATYSPGLLGQFLSSYTLPRAPGTSYEYSNLGFGLLGDLLAYRAHVRFAELLQQRVLEPLGLGSTTMRLSQGDAPRLAPGYSATGHPQPVWTFGDLEAAGGLYSDMSDMLRYLRANLAAPEGALGRAMAIAQAPSAPDDSPSGQTRVGFAWLTNVADGNTFMNGEVGGYHAFIGFNRARKNGIVLLANVADGNADALALHIVAPDAIPAPLSPGKPTSALPEDPAITARAKAWFESLRSGNIDRSQLTPEFSAHVTPELLQQIRDGLAAMGSPTDWKYLGSKAVPGATLYRYQITLGGTQHEWSIAITPDGKIAGSLLR